MKRQRARIGHVGFAGSVGHALVSWWSGCLWLWLAWAMVSPAFGQGRPDIVWMQGGILILSSASPFLLMAV